MERRTISYFFDFDFLIPLTVFRRKLKTYLFWQSYADIIRLCGLFFAVIAVVVYLQLFS